ncbi:hypothetical protein HPB50_018876 [Hyalomma asiaticum]|uniref:Uncharacterized protein n=1 Tax=Hyalomma asiaticum TaxID=266040 RepID=A0ACB7T311_HYAAI|nr:hypothetical protein HPB50_018876 [Hyalomma asiaticum]
MSSCNGTAQFVSTNTLIFFSFPPPGGAVTRLHVRRPLVNMTKDSGDSVRLKCEVAGGRPGARVVFRWYKNDAPVEEERNRLEIRQYPVAPSSSGQASSADGATSGGSAGTSGPQQQQQAAANVPAYGSRLRIVSADVHDTGYYRCEAKIGSEMVETTGILRVSAGPIHHAPAQIPQFPPVFPHFPGLGGRTGRMPNRTEQVNPHLFPLVASFPGSLWQMWCVSCR